METKIPYRTFGSYLKARYGGEVGKICLDGGFTCPNRDGTCGVGGCLFCGERGAGEHIRAGVSVKAQMDVFFARPHKQRKFIAYFQNFSGTYAPTDVLRERYAAALGDSRVVMLAVGTRPDCINEENAALIASFRERCDVLVELGLQTADDRVAEKFRRGYGRKTFERAVEILHRHGIPTVVHLMVGLPGETPEGAIASAEYVAKFPLFGVKIHSVYVMEGTDLAAEYRAGRYVPIGQETYIRTVAEMLTRLPEDFVICRLTGDCPPEQLLAPAWNGDKVGTLEGIRRLLTESGRAQGTASQK